MFTGIITHTSRILRSQQVGDSLTVTFERPKGWPDLKVGDSVATDGVCLTVAALRSQEYDCQLIPATLAITAFSAQLPAVVNLERPLGTHDRFDGHFVQGHVDGVGVVSKIDEADGWDVYVTFPAPDAALVILRGSIAINGVSLTVAAVDDNVLRVSLIPHTLEHTTLGALQVGDAVNLEYDMIGKYIVNVMETRYRHAKGRKV